MPQIQVNWNPRWMDDLGSKRNEKNKAHPRTMRRRSQETRKMTEEDTQDSNVWNTEVSRQRLFEDEQRRGEARWRPGDGERSREGGSVEWWLGLGETWTNERGEGNPGPRLNALTQGHPSSALTIGRSDGSPDELDRRDGNKFEDHRMIWGNIGQDRHKRWKGDWRTIERSDDRSIWQ